MNIRHKRLRIQEANAALIAVEIPHDVRSSAAFLIMNFFDAVVVERDVYILGILDIVIDE